MDTPTNKRSTRTRDRPGVVSTYLFGSQLEQRARKIKLRALVKR